MRLALQRGCSPSCRHRVEYRPVTAVTDHHAHDIAATAGGREVHRAHQIAGCVVGKVSAIAGQEGLVACANLTAFGHSWCSLALGVFTSRSADQLIEAVVAEGLFGHHLLVSPEAGNVGHVQLPDQVTDRIEGIAHVLQYFHAARMSRWPLDASAGLTSRGGVVKVLGQYTVTVQLRRFGATGQVTQRAHDFAFWRPFARQPRSLEVTRNVASHALPVSGGIGDT